MNIQHTHLIIKQLTETLDKNRAQSSGPLGGAKGQTKWERVRWAAVVVDPRGAPFVRKDGSKIGRAAINSPVYANAGPRQAVPLDARRCDRRPYLPSNLPSRNSNAFDGALPTAPPWGRPSISK